MRQVILRLKIDLASHPAHGLIGFDLILWYINNCWLFNTNSYIYIYIYIWFVNTFCRYAQLNDQTVLFQIIHFNMSTKLNGSKYCYVSPVWRGNMTPKYIWPSVDDSSKQELQDSGSGRGCLSLAPSLSLQGEIGMWGPHSLLAMYVSAERQILRPYLVLRKSPQKKKKSTRGEHSKYGK